MDIDITGFEHGMPTQVEMLASALFTCHPGSVVSLRLLSIRSDRPAEQVGEHYGGAVAAVYLVKAKVQVAECRF